MAITKYRRDLGARADLRKQSYSISTMAQSITFMECDTLMLVIRIFKDEAFVLTSTGLLGWCYVSSIERVTT